jgi:hypothetical protein
MTRKKYLLLEWCTTLIFMLASPLDEPASFKVILLVSFKRIKPPGRVSNFSFLFKRMKCTDALETAKKNYSKYY